MIVKKRSMLTAPKSMVPKNKCQPYDQENESNQIYANNN